MQFNVSDAINAYGNIVQGELAGKIQAQQEAQQLQDQSFQRNLQLLQAGQGHEREVNELTERGLTGPGVDPGARLQGFGQLATNAAHSPYTVEKIFRGHLPPGVQLPAASTPAGTAAPPFPASGGAAVPNSGGNPAGGPASSFAMPAAPPVASPAAPWHPPQLQGPLVPQAPGLPAGQAPPAAMGSGQPAGSAVPPVPKPGPTGAAAVGLTPGAGGFEPAPAPPPPTPVQFPGGIQVSAAGVDPKEFTQVQKEIGTAVADLQKLVVADPQQARNISVYARQRPTLESMKTPEGLQAAQQWVLGAQEYTRGLGAQGESQVRQRGTDWKADYKEVVSGSIVNPRELAATLVDLLDRADKLGVEAAGGRLDAQGKPLYGHPAGAGLSAYRKEIGEIDQLQQQGNNAAAENLARVVGNNLRHGVSPAMATRNNAELLRLFAGASTELAHDPATIRAIIKQAGLEATYKEVPDQELGELFFGRAAEKMADGVLGLMPRLKGLDPKVRQPAIDALVGWSKIAHPHAPPIEIDPAQFDRLTPKEQAQVAASKARLKIAQDTAADRHLTFLKHQTLMDWQIAKLQAQAADPNGNQKGARLTPVAALREADRLWTQSRDQSKTFFRTHVSADPDWTDWLYRPGNEAYRNYFFGNNPQAKAPPPPDFSKDPVLAASANDMQEAYRLSKAERERRNDYENRYQHLAGAGGLPGGNPLDNVAPAAPPAPATPAGPALRPAAINKPGGGPPTPGQLQATPRVDPAAFRRAVDLSVQHGADRARAAQYYRQHPGEIR